MYNKETRALATIRKINEIKPIENADKIELAKIDGWQVVVGKGEFKVGDLCVYFEIDSLLPMIPRYEFLKAHYVKIEENGLEGYRLKTAKFRGCLSQGLVIPFDEAIQKQANSISIGQDLTEILSVKKYEKPLPKELLDSAKGYRPGHVPSTSQARVQNIDSVEGVWIATEKIDGESVSYYNDSTGFGATTREVDLKDNGNVIFEFAKRNSLDSKLSSYNIVIQGEFLRAKSKYGNENTDYYVYGIIQDNKVLDYDERLLLCEKFSLKHAPLIFKHKTLNSQEEALELSVAKSKINPKVDAEGLVWEKIKEGIKNSFKSISNKYLLKGGE